MTFEPTDYRDDLDEDPKVRLQRDVITTMAGASEYWEEFSYETDPANTAPNQIYAELHSFNGDEAVRLLDRRYLVTVTVVEVIPTLEEL